MARKDIKRGINYEKKVAKRQKARHVGGPGKEDYKKGKIRGEVKDRKTPITKPELQRLIHKGRNQFNSKSGYTHQAIDYRDHYRPKIKLFQKGKEIIKKKKKK